MSEFIRHQRQTALGRDGAGLTDGQLLGCFLEQRDEAAFAALVQRQGPMVWGVCRRLLNPDDAEDAFQATFLVLVRKGPSIVPRERVANWLYGVAHQTALQARRTATRRRAREKQVSQIPEPAVTDQAPARDLQALLDLELSRLPDAYREVIVLSDLQGKTRTEAARQLGLPEGTVASRLARARTMLAKRLARHSLAVCGGTLAVVLSQDAASAQVPAAVVSSTIRAATLVAAGGALPAQVAALTEGVMKAMLLTKLKLASVVVGVFVLIGGAGVLATRAQGEKGGPAARQVQTNDQRKDTAEKGDPPDAPATKPIQATARLVVMLYHDNDARGDEKLLGKRVRVTGRVLRVQRMVKGQIPYYLLSLYADPSEARGVEVMLFPDKMPLEFVFPADSRKDLAKLQGGQPVTIEGVCKGRTAEGHDAITFNECKIVKAGE
jgi:RNA polymerase sigma factor (sigma-70 family)